MKSGTKKTKKKDELFVAGYFEEEGEKKFIAIKVRNTLLLNPVEPIFEQYPNMECVVVGKDEKAVKKHFEKLIS